eukprot:1160621-Pelagomonas_calceolata.AAC.8
MLPKPRQHFKKGTSVEWIGHLKLVIYLNEDFLNHQALLKPGYYLTSQYIIKNNVRFMSLILQQKRTLWEKELNPVLA